MTKPAFKKGWYLLYTSPKQEKKVSEQLLSVNIPHYLPTIKSARRWSDRLKILTTPMFPRYLFAYLGQQEEYYKSLATKGSLYFVRFGGQITRVADSVVNDLKILVEKGGQFEIVFTELEKGEMLTISEGPLRNLNCEVVRYKNKDMILVRVSLLKRSVLVELPVHHLSKS